MKQLINKNQEIKNKPIENSSTITTAVFSIVDLWKIQKQVRTAYLRRRVI